MGQHLFTAYNESQNIKCEHKGDNCLNPAVNICTVIFCCSNRGCSKNLCEAHTFTRCNCILKNKRTIPTACMECGPRLNKEGLICTGISLLIPLVMYLIAHFLIVIPAAGASTPGQGK